jgi:peptide deformylase
MARHKILKMGNPLLNQIAKTVVDPKIAELVKDIRDSLDAVGGNGLAAPQIGVSLRVVVYRMPKNIIPKGSRQAPVTWTCMINPTIMTFYVSISHTQNDVDRTIEAFSNAAWDIKKHR